MVNRRPGSLSASQSVPMNQVTQKDPIRTLFSPDIFYYQFGSNPIALWWISRHSFLIGLLINFSQGDSG